MWLRKQKQIPVNDSTEAESCVQLWYVKWYSKYGHYHNEYEKEIEAFTSKQEADDFKKSLENAFKLLKYTSKPLTEVTIEKAK